ICCIVVPGGRINSRDVWMYNSQLNIWIRVASLNKGRWRHKMAVLLGKVYAVGGYDGQSRLSSVECYDSFSNRWTEVAPMKEAVSSPAVSSCVNKLFVIGGGPDDNTCSDKSTCRNDLQAACRNVLQIACHNVLQTTFRNVLQVVYRNVLQTSCTKVLQITCHNVLQAILHGTAFCRPHAHKVLRSCRSPPWPQCSEQYRHMPQTFCSAMTFRRLHGTAFCSPHAATFCSPHAAMFCSPHAATEVLQTAMSPQSTACTRNAVLQCPGTVLEAAQHLQQITCRNVLQTTGRNVLQTTCTKVLQTACHDVPQTAWHSVLQATCRNVLQAGCLNIWQITCHNVLQTACHDVPQTAWHSVLQSTCRNILQTACCSVKVQCYDPESDSWLLRANIPIAKRCITAVSLNNLIYVSGGLTKSIYCYDPIEDYWMHVVHTFSKQESCGMSVCNGKIFILGGRGESGEASDTILCYDPATGIITGVAAMPRPISYHGCVTIHRYNENKYSSLASEQKANTSHSSHSPDSTSTDISGRYMYTLIVKRNSCTQKGPLLTRQARLQSFNEQWCPP
ncbi:hypothetical protein NFI96_027268, partial [Prochilodus magdalenae]